MRKLEFLSSIQYNIVFSWWEIRPIRLCIECIMLCFFICNVPRWRFFINEKFTSIGFNINVLFLIAEQSFHFAYFHFFRTYCCACDSNEVYYDFLIFVFLLTLFPQVFKMFSRFVRGFLTQFPELNKW